MPKTTGSTRPVFDGWLTASIEQGQIAGQSIEQGQISGHTLSLGKVNSFVDYLPLQKACAVTAYADGIATFLFAGTRIFYMRSWRHAAGDVTYSQAQRLKQARSNANLWKTLDRVNVLGEDDDAFGHTGCVNALSWIDDTTLASSGDDTRVHFWRMDSSGEADHQFRCTAIIDTGHRSNIFNVQRLPVSNTVATCARDSQVRVFDASRALVCNVDSGVTWKKAEVTRMGDEACLRVLRCHRSDVKRIVAEGPDRFLTVSEDATVRQHDLRVPHTCTRRRDGCPPPLVEIPSCPLNAITMATTLAPYYFVVAGESPYGFLFDRRMIRGAEWGITADRNNMTTCVRRFARSARGPNETPGSEHITGAKLSSDNAQELLLCAQDPSLRLTADSFVAYHGDAVYRFFINDEPGSFGRESPNSFLQPNIKRRRVEDSSNGAERSQASSEDDVEMLEDDGVDVEDEPDLANTLTISTEQDDPVDEDEGLPENLRTPVILPRSRYTGHCNINTIKDVNFLGIKDAYVVSGSDDGHWFMWNKENGSLEGIFEGDGDVVNVIEGHPTLPIVACSGIDHTVKIFAATPGKRLFSRIDQAAEIMQANSLQSSQEFRRRIGLQDLFIQYQRSMMLAQLRGAGEGDDDDDAVNPRCVNQ